MIADCAIDPQVFATWTHFQSLSEDFGVSRGRLISKFPKTWVRTVAEHSRKLVKQGINTELQAAKIEERLRSEKFKWKLKSPGGREYEPTQSWILNAEGAKPIFDLIITEGSVGAGNKVGANMLSKDEPPFLRATQIYVPRTKEDLVRAARLLLVASKHVVIIDPNFRADEQRFYDVLKHLISVIEDTGSAPTRFEVHTNRIRKPGETFLRGPHQSQWDTHVVPNLPVGWTLSVCYWDQLPTGGKQHARFLLTEFGGIYYDHGIDEGNGETLVTLLDDGVWQSLFRQFDSRVLPKGFDSDQFVLNLTG